MSRVRPAARQRRNGPEAQQARSGRPQRRGAQNWPIRVRRSAQATQLTALILGDPALAGCREPASPTSRYVAGPARVWV